MTRHTCRGQLMSGKAALPKSYFRWPDCASGVVQYDAKEVAKRRLSEAKAEAKAYALKKETRGMKPLSAFFGKRTTADKAGGGDSGGVTPPLADRKCSEAPAIAADSAAGVCAAAASPAVELPVSAA